MTELCLSGGTVAPDTHAMAERVHSYSPVCEMIIHAFPPVSSIAQFGLGLCGSTLNPNTKMNFMLDVPLIPYDTAKCAEA